MARFLSGGGGDGPIISSGADAYKITLGTGGPGFTYATTLGKCLLTGGGWVVV